MVGVVTASIPNEVIILQTALAKAKAETLQAMAEAEYAKQEKAVAATELQNVRAAAMCEKADSDLAATVAIGAALQAAAEAEAAAEACTRKLAESHTALNAARADATRDIAAVEAVAIRKQSEAAADLRAAVDAEISVGLSQLKRAQADAAHQIAEAEAETRRELAAAVLCARAFSVVRQEALREKSEIAGAATAARMLR